MYCHKCGGYNPENSKFCLECGSELEVGSKVYCPECGQQLENGTKFCHICGRNVSFFTDEDSEDIPKPQPTPIPGPFVPGGTEILGQYTSNDLIGGRYKVIKKLGQGGFAATYLVEHSNLKERVVLKELIHSSEKGRELFDREAMTMRSLNLKGVPSVTDYFDEGNKSFIVQSYVDGETLSQRLKRSKLTESEGMTLLNSILEILNQIHMKGIIHRDIKPDNIIIDSNGEYNLIDFGAVKIAAAVNNEGKSNTNIGTPGYAAIEQLNGNALKASDIYSLGMVVAESITGVNVKQLRRGADVEDINLAEFNIKNDNLIKIVKKMTEVVVDKRYQNVEEIMNDIDCKRNGKVSVDSSISTTVVQDKNKKKKSVIRPILVMIIWLSLTSVSLLVYLNFKLW